MALISCRECGKQISDQAVSCPHCGAPVRQAAPPDPGVLAPAVSPSIAAEKPDPLEHPLATRWPRFFARMFDVYWEIVAVGYPLAWILNRYSVAFVEWINGPSGQFYGLVCLPLALLLDAAIYRVFGNTPGKAFAGLMVTTLRGEALTFGQYLDRNSRVWASGMGLGIPFVTVFTMYAQSRRLDKGQQASYDEIRGHRVHARPIGLMRQAAFGISFLAVFGGHVALNAIEKVEESDRIVSDARQDYVWVNPFTGLSAKIEARWKHRSENNADGQPIHIFSERTDRAIVVVGIEQAANMSLHDYIDSLRRNTASHMRYADGGRFLRLDGHDAWQGSGKMVEDSSIRFSSQVVKIGPVFWRVVVTQALPYEYSDGHAAQLQAALWTTVK